MNAVVKTLPSVLVLVVTGPGVWAEELDLSGRTTAGDDTYVACTCVGIREGKWTINGNVTYAGSPAEGLLMNVRVVNATFEDRDKPDFDADVNTEAFLACLPEYVACWIKERGFQNVVLEIANEFPHRGFDHPILKRPEGQARLIRLARETHSGLLVSASGYGDGKLPEAVAQASDFLLIHFNGVRVDDIPDRINRLRRFGKPIVCNEDDPPGPQRRRSRTGLPGVSCARR